MNMLTGNRRYRIHVDSNDPEIILMVLQVEEYVDLDCSDRRWRDAVLEDLTEFKGA